MPSGIRTRFAASSSSRATIFRPSAATRSFYRLPRSLFWRCAPLYDFSPYRMVHRAGADREIVRTCAGPGALLEKLLAADCASALATACRSRGSSHHGPGRSRVTGFHQSIRVPISVVAGDADQVADVRRQSLRLHKMLPQSRLWLLRGAGHMSHYSSPRAVVDAIDYVAGRAALAWGRGLARVSSAVR